MFSVDFAKVPIAGNFIKFLRGNDMDYGLHVTTLIGLFLFIGFSVSKTLIGTAFSFFFNLAPIWLPMMAFGLFNFRWMDYVGKKFYLQNGRTTFRIKLPQEVSKSPEAMDFVLTQLWNKQTIDNYWQSYIDGKKPLQNSLEIVSIGGEVRFYVNVPTKKVIEQFLPAIYSQYPGVEVIEEPVDYAMEIPLGDPDWDVFSTHINKKDMNYRYSPIKTYVDFGLDKMPDEDEKVDPLTPMLELLSQAKPQERIYIQFIITPFRTKSLQQGSVYQWKETPGWNEDVLRKVDEILHRDPETKAPLNAGEADFEGSPRISPGEREEVEALERNAEKYAYYTGIRVMYAVKKGHFRGTLIFPINRTLAQWDTLTRAALGVRWRTDFNYMWFSDPFGDRLRALKKIEHKFFKQRKWVPMNFIDGPHLFTTEELASIFHLPGRVAISPTVDRVPSTRGQAPPNLPVGDLPQT